MKLIVVGTGSSGNGYILTNGKESLLIEAGMPLKDVKKALDFNISSIHGCLISHSHGDHSKYAKDYIKNGIKVYSSFETISEIGCVGHSLESGSIYYHGSFIISPFVLKHDVKCFGYMIYHKEIGKLIFATDTSYIPYTFKEVSTWLLECNYDTEIIDEKTADHELNLSLRNRITSSHLSLSSVKKILISQNLSLTTSIVLLHMSDSNSDENKFVDEIQSTFGIKTYSAKNGLEIQLKIL